MSFKSDVTAVVKKADGNLKKIFVNTAAMVQESVVEGSPLTGAPGQPVQTSNLKTSFHLSFPKPFVAELSTNVAYARPIEDGIGPHGEMQVRSEVGGFHSVKLTLAGAQRLVDAAAAKSKG